MIKSTYLSTLLFFLAVVIFAGDRNRHTLPSYTITDIGCLPGDQSSQALAVNNHGQVLGFSWGASDENDENPEKRVFLWQDGRYQDLGGFSAQGLSDSGAVVGNRVILGGKNDVILIVACVYTNHLKDLVSPANTGLSTANSTNSQGEIVGKQMAAEPPSKNACQWGTKNGILKIPLGYRGSEAYAINEEGHISGEVGRLNHNATRSFSNAVVWRNSICEVLVPLAGYQESTSVAINNKDVVVGNCFNPTRKAGVQQRACLWVDGHVQDLGTLSKSGISIARAVNDLGEVVGNSETVTGNYLHAFLWQNGRMMDLNTLIASRSEWMIVNASGINNIGQIVCNGSQDGKMHALLLTPVTQTALADN